MAQNQSNLFEQGLAKNNFGAAKNTQILARLDDMEGSSWKLGLWETIHEPEIADAVAKLAEKAVHKNVFFDPAFLKNSTVFIARKKVQFLFLTETYGDHTNLRFFVPVTQERLGPFGIKYFRVWSNEFSPLGQPLIAGRGIEHTVDKLLMLSKMIDPDQARGILMNSIPKKTKFLKGLYKRQAASQAFTFFNHYERASLLPLGGQKYAKMHLSGKRRQRLNASKRKLSELGEVKIVRTETSPDIEVALLDFLYLEKRGWKGKKNTALASNDDTRHLAMEVVRDLSSTGKCEIHTMYLDENAIASIIFLKSDGYYVAWKVAYDERYAPYSVGNLLTVHATEAVAENSQFKLLDSVAIANNSYANSFWRDQMPLCSVSIGFGEDAAANSKKIAFNLSILLQAKWFVRKLIARKTH